MRLIKPSLLLVLCTLIAAAPATPPGTDTGDALPLAAKAAKAQYETSLDKARQQMDAAIEKALKEFQDQEGKLRATYVAKLDEAIASETKKRNLDGALAVREEKRAVETSSLDPAANPGSSTTAPAVKPGLILCWDGMDHDGKPFPYAKLVQRIPLQMNKDMRALPVKVPDATPAFLRGYIRIAGKSEKFVLNAKADAWTQIRVDIDGASVVDLDNHPETREFSLDHGLHAFSLRFAGGGTVNYQLLLKRTGQPFNDYVFDSADLTNMQVIK